MKSKNLRYLWLLLLLPVLCAGIIFAVPSLRDRAIYHLELWRMKIRYAIFPPEEAVFVPGAQTGGQTPIATIALPTATPSPEPTLTPTVENATPMPTSTPTLMPTALPASAQMNGVKYVNQHERYNYCAPANLAMELSYLGWNGTRDDIGPILKPFEKDKNVMPYEMQNYVETQTDYGVIVRSGGTMTLLKDLVANQFPVLIEKGVFLHDLSGKDSWMGHYQVVIGYDDAQSQFMTHDSFFNANYPVSYSDLAWQWRSFNNTFLIIYDKGQEARLFNILGSYVDEVAANQTAAAIAQQEINTLTGRDLFFAWFNYGTSLVNLQDFAGAATAYDQAFAIYGTIEEKERPWRMMWYQTGPYFAYYYTGRYYDVLNLADTTLNSTDQPYLEESYVWRARAKIALGDTAGAVEDVRKALEYHTGFAPAVDLASQLGISQ